MAGKIIVFANQKGGVGKTTSAANLGAYMAVSGRRILLIDFDPQGNLTSSVGADGKRPGIYEVLSGKLPIRDSIQETPVPNLRVIASNIDLTGANVELIEEENREFFLRRLLEPIVSDWDYILIDCPPSLGLLTINGLVAADHVFIPLQCEYFALEGLSLLLKTIQRIQHSTNPKLTVGGIIFTMYDSRTRLAREVVEEVTGYFKDKVFRTIIPRNVRLSEAPSHGRPINLYDAESIGARSYQKLSEEVLNRV
ncbi:MAG TPA: ParA family protein [Spirochaetia bacterium]|nr:ParA family protein [Spirochaetia bacterium]